MKNNSPYMTAEECKARLYKDTGRSDFHAWIRSSLDSEEEYLEILNYIKRKLNIYDLEHQSGVK